MFRFRVRRAAVSPGGWLARPLVRSSGTLFWKRLPILMGTGRCRRACLASEYGRCETRLPNIPQRVLTSLVASAAMILNGNGPRGLSITKECKTAKQLTTWSLAAYRIGRHWLHGRKAETKASIDERIIPPTLLIRAGMDR